jgi:photosystem II stability/assembly factor-like uncharacterized protein
MRLGACFLWLARVAAIVALLAVSASSRRALARAYPIRLDTLMMVSARMGWGVSNRILLRTTDGARTWRNVMPPGAGHPAELATAFLSASQAWIATASSQDYEISTIVVYRTGDGGRSWQSSTLPVLGGVEPGQRLTVSDPRHGWLLINEGVGAGQNPYVLVRTSDGGRHWSVAARYDSTRRTRGSFPGCDCTDALTFRSASTGWATGNPFAYPFLLWLYRTTDGGRTWTRQAPAAPRGFTHADTYPPRLLGRGLGILPVQLYGRRGAHSFELYVTHDGGAHWGSTTLLRLRPGTAFAQSFADLDHGWVTDGHALYRTIDGGRRWTIIHPRVPAAASRFWRASGQPEIAALDFVSASTGFTTGQSASGRPLPFVLRTVNRGRSWQYVATVD